MHKTLVLWSDQTAGRMIKYVVDYSIADDMLHVFDVTPVEVSIIDMMSETIQKKIPVLADQSRNLLRNRFINAGMLEQLVDRIASNHDLTVVT